MAEGLPPVIVTLIMDNAEFEASAAESKATMAELGAASETTAAKVDASGATIGATGTKAGSLVTSGIKKLSTAVIGAGVAGLAATAYFFLGPKGKQHQRHAKAWAIKMKGDVIEQLERRAQRAEQRVKELSQEHNELLKRHENIESLLTK